MNLSYRHRAYRDRGYWPATTDYYKLTDLTGLLAQSERIDGAQVDFLKTFFVLDIRHLPVVANALILDSERGIISTTQTVPQLMQVVLASLKFDAQQLLQALVKQLGLSGFKLPLLCGDMAFLPMKFRGLPGRHWFGAHQFSNATTVDDGTMLQLCNGLRLWIPVTKRALVGQLDRIRILQRHLADDQAYYLRFNYGGAIVGRRLASAVAQAGYRHFSQQLHHWYDDLAWNPVELEGVLMRYFKMRVH